MPTTYSRQIVATAPPPYKRDSTEQGRHKTPLMSNTSDETIQGMPGIAAGGVMAHLNWERCKRIAELHRHPLTSMHAPR